jgi:aminoglycoside/choline kinase family phosphotransferase
MAKMELSALSAPLQSYLDQWAGGHPDQELEPVLHLAGEAGSGRKYCRIHTLDWNPSARTGQSWIVMFSPVDEDFERFAAISQWLYDAGMPVAELFVVDRQAGQMLLADLGRYTLQHTLEEPHRAAHWYPRMLQFLDEWLRLKDQVEILPSVASRIFGVPDLLWETQYFADHCLGDWLGIDQSERDALKPAFEALAQRVDGHSKNLMHRDFQSQNLMALHGNLYVIDFQGARWGTHWYDLASGLWDPYTMLSLPQVQSLFNTFCEMRDLNPLKAWPEFLDASLQRLMQASGAYANLSLNKGKADFAKHREPGRQRLIQVLQLSEECGQDWSQLLGLLAREPLGSPA